MIEYIDGIDLCEMTDEIAVETAVSLAKLQNAYWEEEKILGNIQNIENRFDTYWKRILKRAAFVAEDPLLKEAYQLFLDRQLTCPRTLSMGDFLQENLIRRDNKVYIIDWGFGGKMPYSLDAARFIAHGSETREPFPIYMTIKQKKIFLDTLYEGLINKPEKATFLYDIKLAVLNEYVEFMEAGEDADGWYSRHAMELAEELVNASDSREV